MATTIRLVEQVIGGQVRVRPLEVTRHGFLQPLALYNLKELDEVRAYIIELRAAIDLPVLDGRGMEFASATSRGDD